LAIKHFSHAEKVLRDIITELHRKIVSYPHPAEGVSGFFEHGALEEILFSR